MNFEIIKDVIPIGTRWIACEAGFEVTVNDNPTHVSIVKNDTLAAIDTRPSRSDTNDGKWP